MTKKTLEIDGKWFVILWQEAWDLLRFFLFIRLPFFSSVVIFCIWFHRVNRFKRHNTAQLVCVCFYGQCLSVFFSSKKKSCEHPKAKWHFEWMWSARMRMSGFVCEIHSNWIITEPTMSQSLKPNNNRLPILHCNIRAQDLVSLRSVCMEWQHDDEHWTTLKPEKVWITNFIIGLCILWWAIERARATDGRRGG